MTLPQPAICRVLLLLLLLVQYAVSAHATEHHLFDDPIGSVHCDDNHLQLPLAPPLAVVGFSAVPATAEVVAFTAKREPQPRQNHAYFSRAPPATSPGH